MLLTTLDPVAVEFDRLARHAFGAVQPGRMAGFAPAMRMDAVRRDDQIELKFDLPGIDTESIDVTVDHGVLTVSAQSEKYSEGEKPFIRERVSGSFKRQLRLSDAVDAEKAEADYGRGILTVRLPLAERALPRKIEVQTKAAAEISA